MRPADLFRMSRMMWRFRVAIYLEQRGEEPYDHLVNEIYRYSFPHEECEVSMEYPITCISSCTVCRDAGVDPIVYDGRFRFSAVIEPADEGGRRGITARAYRIAEDGTEARLSDWDERVPLLRVGGGGIENLQIEQDVLCPLAGGREGGPRYRLRFMLTSYGDPGGPE